MKGDSKPGTEERRDGGPLPPKDVKRISETGGERWMGGNRSV